MTNTMAKKTLEDLCCDKILLELYPFMDFLVAADPILSAVPVNLEEDDGHGPVLEEASQEPANILDVVSTQEPSEKGKLNTEDAAVEPPSRPLSELSSNFDILEGFSEESSISESLAEPVNYIEQDNLREAYRIPTEQDHLKAKLEEPKQSIITSHARKRKQNNTTHEIFIGSPGAAETIKPSQNKRRKLELISSPKRSQTKTQRQNADSGVRDTNWKNNTIAVFEASSRIISKILNNLQPDNFVNEDENLKLLAAKHLSILEKLEKWEPNQRAQRQTYQKGENRNNVAQNKRRGYIDRMIKRQKDTDNGIDDYKETCRADYETSNDAGKAFIDRILDEIGEYKPFVPKPRHNPTAYRAPDANELHNLRELLFGDNPPKHHDQVLSNQDEIPIFDIEWLTVSNVDGDGHCGYRALSMLLSGTQDNHFAIRNLINVAIRDRDRRLPQSYYNFYGFKVSEEAARQINVINAADKMYWMGYEQILALSLLIGINIAVYRQNARTWMIYNKKTLALLSAGKQADNRTLDKKLPTLLLYHGGSHFEPVVSVS